MRGEADSAKNAAISAQAETRENLYLTEMKFGADAAKSASGIEQLEEIVDHWLPVEDEKDLRGWEWYWLESVSEREDVVIQTFPPGWQNTPVHSVDFSPDGSLIAWTISSVIQVARIDGIEVFTELLGENGKGIYCIRFSHDGRRLAACGEDQLVRIWDIETQKRVFEKKFPEAMGAVCWSPDDRLIAVQTNFVQPASIHIVDVEKNEEVATLNNEIDGHLRSIEFSPDGKWLASGGYTPNTNHYVNVWNASNWKLLDRKLLHRQAVYAVAWSLDSKRVVSASADGSVKIWDIASGDIQIISGEGLGRISVAWGPNDKYIISGSRDFSATIWDANDGTVIDVLRGHKSVVQAVAWNDDEALIATTGNDGYVRLWDMLRAPPFRSLKQNTTSVWHKGGHIAWSPDGKRIAAANNQPFTIWDANSGEPLFLHVAPDNDVGYTQLGERPSWSSDGQFLVSSYRGLITVWNSSGTEQIRTIDQQGMNSASFSPVVSDNRLALTYNPPEGTSSIFTVDIINESTRIEIARDLDKIELFSWSPDGTRICVSSGKSTTIVDSATGDTLAKSESDVSVASIGWSPDGEKIVTGNLDHSVTIRDAQTMHQLKLLRGHTFSVWSVAWSPDGKRIATASGDKTVRLWNPVTGKTTLVLDHDDEVKFVAWSPEGHRLASMSQDAIMKVWDANRGYFLESRANRTSD